MKSMDVLLNSMDKVKRFVNDMRVVEGNVIICSDQVFVNAKSIMGIFTLNLAEPLELRIENWKEEYIVLVEKYLTEPD